MSDLEKMDQPNSNGNDLRRVDTISSVSLTNEQFERLYLGPQNKVKGDLRKTFANPTPIGLTGFILAFAPLVCTFMEWRGAAGLGASTVGGTIFLGGMLALLSCVGEFILGNSFPSLFFGVYGAFFVAYGVTTIPYFGASSWQAAAGITNAGEQVQSAGFNSAVGFLGVFLGIFTLFLVVASLRTNVFFFIAFLTLDLAIWCFVASKFYTGEGNMVMAHRTQVASGACGFVTVLCGLYLLLAEVLTTVDFPVNLPVFELSQYIPGASDIARRKRQHDEENLHQ